jgi:hypothetical protein
MEVSARQPAAQVGVSGLSGLARGGVPLWLPLPFLLTGVACAALFGVLLPFIVPEALLASGFPHVLALVHTVTLGWLTMTIMGASLQLAPVMLASPLRAAGFVRAQYPVYMIGVALLVTGFWITAIPLLIAGGALVIVAVAHFVTIVGATIASAPKRPLTARYLVAALIYLCAVVSLGLTAALNFAFGFLGAGAERLLLAHITLGVAGWLTCTLIGVSYTLTRLFALAHGHDDKLGRLVFPLLNVGVIGLALSFSLGWTPLEWVGGASLVAAVWLFAYDYRGMLRARMRKPLDVTQLHAIASVGYLSLTVTAGVGLALFGGASEPTLVALALAALVGWLGQSALGYLYKIVPFLVWQSRYGPLVGRQPVPLMRDLIHQRAAWLSLWLINGALALMIVVAALDWALAAQVAAALLGLGLMVAALNVFGALAPRAVASPAQSRHYSQPSA